MTKTVTYNAIGNITTKSDVGAYTYDPARVHAVASIAPGGTGTVTASYTYDANGNMLTGRGRTVTWTSFDMVGQITQGTNSVSFTYDSDHARLKQVSSDGSTKYYLNDPISGAMAEKIVGASQSVTWNNYIMLGGEMVALKVTGATTQTRYFHKDHLGSIVALTDESGAVVERDSFDAWGQRRTPAGQDDPLYPGQSITSQITRGYTGHEQLDSVGLVHMNGRIYEPVIGKMMSADPTVPDPINGQAYNRYSYVLNNPLSLTDPTGFYDVDPDHPGRMGDPLGRDQPDSGGKGGNGGPNEGLSDADPVGDVTTGAPPPKKPGDLQLACGPCVLAIPPAVEAAAAAYQAYRAYRAAQALAALVAMAEANRTDEAETAEETGGDESSSPDPDDDDQEEETFERLEGYKEHLTDRDLEAARREGQGEVVSRKSDGTPYDHRKEVNEAIRGIKNRVAEITRKLNSPSARLSEAEQAALNREREAARAMIERAKNATGLDGRRMPSNF